MRENHTQVLTGGALYMSKYFELDFQPNLWDFGLEKKIPLETNTDNFDDVGDPDEARINLSRSLFEMGQTAKAKELLQEVLLEENLSEKNKVVIQNLLKKFSHAWKD